MGENRWKLCKSVSVHVSSLAVSKGSHFNYMFLVLQQFIDYSFSTNGENTHCGQNECSFSSDSMNL